MTRIFTDGAEMGDLLSFDNSKGLSNVTTAPRSGNRHYYIGAAGYAIRNIPAAAEYYFRFAVYFFGGANTFFVWENSGAVLGRLIRNTSTNKIEIYTPVGTLVATGSHSLQNATWYCIEVHVKIDNAVGVITVKIDGVTDATFSGNTQPGAETTIDNFMLNGGNGDIYADDLAVNDTTGAADNSWCGDGKIVMLRPTAAGDVTQLAPSAGANWGCVDETPPNTTDYVSSAVAGQYDLYNCDTHALAAGEVVRRVQVEARVLEESALGDSIKLGAKTEATEYFDAGQAVITSYQRYVGNDLPTNPNTGLAWTQAELDAIQAGVKVV